MDRKKYYRRYLRTKTIEADRAGWEIDENPYPFLREHQVENLRFHLRQGRSANFADRGNGKTNIGCAWAHQVAQRTGGAVLWVGPLQVIRQMEGIENAKFGWEMPYITDPSEVDESRPGVYMTNYERLKNFDPSKFRGIVLDEASILKQHSGKWSTALIDFASHLPYRLALTATPVTGGDISQIGLIVKFLDVLDQRVMLARWFCPDQSKQGKQDLKPHGRAEFFSWVAQWAVGYRTPSDIGCSDHGYVLPPFRRIPHAVDVDFFDEVSQPKKGENMLLFRCSEKGVQGEHKEARITAADRARETARLISEEPDKQWCVWGMTDYDTDEIARMLEGESFVNVHGKMSADAKADALLAFVRGEIRVLITKPKIAAFGLNLQNCHRVAVVSTGSSFEMSFQLEGRFYRSGQTEEVHFHYIFASTDGAQFARISNKRGSHEIFVDSLIEAQKNV